MKYKSLLVFSVLLAAIAVSCSKENASGNMPSGTEGVGEIFILNEGAGDVQSSLDYMDLKTGTLKADVFKQANPEIALGMGKWGNDLAIVNDKLWVLMNGSNIVLVLNPATFKLEKTLDIDSPRFIEADANYAYMTSYGAAVYGGDPTNGYLYRIKLSDYSMDKVEVGPQPEGVAILDDKIYVANSGGYNYVHDNRVMAVDKSSFTVTATYELGVTNLFLMKSASDRLWVNTYGESSWSQDGAGNWIESPSAPKALVSLKADGSDQKTVEGVHASKMTLAGTDIYAFGNDAEMTGGSALCLYKVNTVTSAVTKTAFSGSAMSRVVNPYGIAVTPSGDILISDTGDPALYTANCKLYCFDSSLKFKWQVEVGPCAGHILAR